MTTPTELPILSDDAVLCDWLAPLLDRAISRQLWTILLDNELRPGPFLANDDYPADPNEPQIVDDLGLCTAAELVADRFARGMADAGWRAMIVVWERPGPASLRGEQLAWARAFGEQLRLRGVELRAQLLLHGRGLRMLTPADLS